MTAGIFRPILWGHSGPFCHALSLLLLCTSILHCHSPCVATVARLLRYSYSWLRLILVVVSSVATPGEWQCKIRTGGVRRLAVANGPNIFQMLQMFLQSNCFYERCQDRSGRMSVEHSPPTSGKRALCQKIPTRYLKIPFLQKKRSACETRTQVVVDVHIHRCSCMPVQRARFAI